MQSSFYLGFNHLWDELLVIQQPGMYWLNVDRQKDAAAFCRQTLRRQTAQTDAALISVGAQPRLIVDSLGRHGLQRLSLFSLPSSRQAILALSDDLMRSIKPRNMLLTLYAPTSVWKMLTVSELARWCADMSDWLRQQQCSLLIFNVGVGGESLRSHLLAQHRALSGLSNLLLSGDDLKYEVDFWCNGLGVSAGESINALIDDQGLRADQDDQRQPAFISDEFITMAVKSVMNAQSPPENWQLFSSNEALAAAGQQVRMSTLVFALEKRDQLDSLVYQIYNLRKQRGNGLKIVVRAMTPNMRANDEYILQAGGANLTVSYTVRQDKFMAMLEAIQGVVFSRYIPDDLAGLIKAIKPLPLRGYVTNKIFSESVINLMSNGLLPEDGKGLLLFFTPAAGLTAKQALTLCRIRRDGDLVTLFNHRLVLFLSNCKVNELNSTLRFIFRLPVEQAFSHRDVWSSDRDILTQLYRLQSQVSADAPMSEAPESLAPAEDEKVITAVDDKTAPSIRREPQEISLSLSVTSEAST
jgi:cellulose biosynthesis protein BcsE